MMTFTEGCPPGRSQDLTCAELFVGGSNSGFWQLRLLWIENLIESNVLKCQKTAVIFYHESTAVFGFILTQAVIIKLMTTSHPIEGNFTSDFPEDSKTEADEKIVIDRLLVNKLTELLINSIYSVHVSRRSEIFLTSLDMHLAENSISNKNNKASHEFTEKSSLLLESYQKAVPKLLGKAESSLEEAIDLINLVVSASETGDDNG